MKYSCCHWDNSNSLEEAELEMLDLTITRADISDGQTILELGCGWGAITLAMAERFPNSKIVAISNSPEQRNFILNKAKNKNINNIEVRTHNVAELELSERFDRVVSVEMFEHMRNYPKLLEKFMVGLTQRVNYLYIFLSTETFLTISMSKMIATG